MGWRQGDGASVTGGILSRMGGRKRVAAPWLVAALVAACVAVLGPGSAVAQDQTPPYWASIDAPRAILRRGPSQQMRALWEYHRPGLPVKVLALHEDWRKIEEPDGTTGWMHRSLLTGRRTAIVVDALQPIRTAPDPSAPVAFRAEPGVIGRIADCADGWCAFDVTGRRGYIAFAGIWGEEALQ
jgi:SH3-like domain-containing protein